MKKIATFLKSNVLIIFGALLFLNYLNFLSGAGMALAIGIIATVCSVYYLIVGIIEVVLGDKVSSSAKKVLDIISSSFFTVFMFVYFLLIVINAAGIIGPTGWIIYILSLAAALACASFSVISKFSDKEIVWRLSILFSGIFVLALLLDILFNTSGNAVTLGDINVILFVIYALFAFYLFSSIKNKNEEIKEAKTNKELSESDEDKNEDIELYEENNKED